MKRSWLGPIVVALVLAVPGLAAAAPISAYYLTAGDQGTNWLVQGASATSFAQAHPGGGGEYGIAASGTTVRTIGNGNGGEHGLGNEYTLAGVATGTTYAYPGGAGTSFYDGTSDGTFNYTVDFQNGDVYRTNLDWTNATVLFNTGTGADSVLGITFDSTNGSLWISGWSSNAVRDFSLGGTLLSSFSASQSSLSSLGFDAADGTLWMGSQSTEGTFYQYSRTGTLLSTTAYAALNGQNTLGGEFVERGAAAVPEPMSLVLVGSGLALAARRLRARRA